MSKVSLWLTLIAQGLDHWKSACDETSLLYDDLVCYLGAISLKAYQKKTDQIPSHFFSAKYAEMEKIEKQLQYCEYLEFNFQIWNALRILMNTVENL